MPELRHDERACRMHFVNDMLPAGKGFIAEEIWCRGII
jgi:hypothetical protein